MTFKELSILVCITTSFIFVNVSIDGNTRTPFHFDVILDKNLSVFTFTCELSERPVGGAILVQVNFSTVDIIRHKNNSCYDKDNQCQNNTCVCSYEGGKFGMEYWYKTPNVSQSYNFGVEMLLKDGKANIVVVTLSRIYNGKDSGKLQIVKESADFNSNENIDVTNIGLENKANRSKIQIYLTASCVVLIVVSCFIWSCRSKETGCHNVAKYSLYTQVVTHSRTHVSKNCIVQISDEKATRMDIFDNCEDSIYPIKTGRSLKSTTPVSRLNTFSFNSPAPGLFSDELVVRNATVLHKCDSPEVNHIGSIAKTSTSIVCDYRPTTVSVHSASAEVRHRPAKSDESVVYFKDSRKLYPIQIGSTVPSKVNDKITDSASEVSSSAKSDDNVIDLSNFRNNLQLENSQIIKYLIRISSYFEKQGKFLFSGDHIQAIMAIKPILAVRISEEQTEKVRMYEVVLSGLIASKSRTNGSQKLIFLPITLLVRNGLFTIQKAPSVLIDFSRQKTLDMMHHLYIQHTRFIVISWHNYAVFTIPKLRKEDVLKELSNQIGKSAFHLRIELGVNFYEINGSFFNFLKILAALLWKRNAQSKSSFKYFSIDVLKRVNGVEDKYILRWSK